MSKKNNKILIFTLGGFLIWKLLKTNNNVVVSDESDKIQNCDNDLYFGPDEYDPFYDLNKNRFYIESKFTNDSINSSANMNWRIDSNSFYIGIDEDTLINPLSNSKWKGNKSFYYYRFNFLIEIFNPFNIQHYIDLVFDYKEKIISYNNDELIPWDSNCFIEFLYTCYSGDDTKNINQLSSFVEHLNKATSYIDDEKSFNSIEEERFPMYLGHNSYEEIFDYAIDYVKDKYSTTKDNARVALLATKGIFLLEAIIQNKDYKEVIKKWAWDRLKKQKFSLVWGSDVTDAITVNNQSSIFIEPINGADFKFISLSNPFSKIERGLAPNFQYNVSYYSDQITTLNKKNFIIKYGKSINMIVDYSNDYINIDLNDLERFTYLNNTEYFNKFLQMMGALTQEFGEQQLVGEYGK